MPNPIEALKSGELEENLKLQACFALAGLAMAVGDTIQFAYKIAEDVKVAFVSDGSSYSR